MSIGPRADPGHHELLNVFFKHFSELMPTGPSCITVHVSIAVCICAGAWCLSGHTCAAMSTCVSTCIAVYVSTCLGVLGTCIAMSTCIVVYVSTCPGVLGAGGGTSLQGDGGAAVW